MASLVADLGGTFLRCALIADDGAVLHLERMRLAGSAGSRAGGLWLEIIESIVAFSARHANFLAPNTPIAFAFPGPITGGLPSAAPTVMTPDGSGGRLPDLRGLLRAHTGREIVIINDVSAAAWYFSERLSASRFAVVTVSSGIGAKIFDRRHPLGVIDDVASAGEIGHLVVDHRANAVVCDCGGRGHLGAVSSARAIELRARAAAHANLRSFVQSLCVTKFGATVETLSNEDHLVPALLAYDDWSTTILSAAVEPLADVLAALVVGCGLETIAILGGFPQRVGEIYRRMLADAIQRRLHPGMSSFDGRPTVVIAPSGDEPSLSGLAAFTRRERAVA